MFKIFFFWLCHLHLFGCLLAAATVLIDPVDISPQTMGLDSPSAVDALTAQPRAMAVIGTECGAWMHALCAEHDADAKQYNPYRPPPPPQQGSEHAPCLLIVCVRGACGWPS